MNASIKLIAMFNYDPTTTGYHKGTYLKANQDHIDQMIIDNHVANGGTFSENVKKITKKKIIGANGMKVDLYEIDGVVYEVYADFSAIVHKA